jgi:ComF family protein
MGDLLHLIFPRTCVVCTQELSANEKGCCSFCVELLPFTHFEKMVDPSPVDQLFWGRVQVESTFSLLHYEKDSSVQKILYRIKYGNDHQLAIRMGQLMAQRMKGSEVLKGVDAFLPVPVHHQKRFMRGYNQSEMIAMGIHEATGVPIELGAIKRNTHTKTQTKKGRDSRWDNVAEIFSLTNPEKLEGKYVLLVDDVLTTGATLEACGSRILAAPNVKLAIATVAYA